MSDDESLATPLSFTRTISEEYVRATIVIPLFFMLIKTSDFEPIAHESAAFLVETIGYIIPVVPDQFQAVLKIRGRSEAAFYALFLVCVLTTWPFLLLYTLRQYLVKGPQLSLHSPRDVAALFVMLFAAAYVLFWDTARKPYFTLHSFFPDDFGLYYLRQYIALSVLVVTIILLLALAAKICRFRENPR
jgi:hypothetical protein